VVSTTLGQSHPSDSEVYGAGIFKLTDGSLFHVGTCGGGFHTWLGISPDRDTAIAVACNLYDIDIETVAETYRPSGSDRSRLEPTTSNAVPVDVPW
jgi:hypothetical protein